MCDAHVVQEYIHRVGRTARGEGAQGRALLFLIPEELGFLRYLKVSELFYLCLVLNLRFSLIFFLFCGFGGLRCKTVSSRLFL